MLAAAMCLGTLLNVLLQPKLGWASFQLVSRNNFGIAVLLAKVLFGREVRSHTRVLLELLIAVVTLLTMTRALWLSTVTMLIFVSGCRIRLKRSPKVRCAALGTVATLSLIVPVVGIGIG